MLVDISTLGIDDDIFGRDNSHIIEIRDPVSDPILGLFWDDDAFAQILTRSDNSLIDQRSEIIGVPGIDSEYWQRQEGNTCALMAAAGIIRSMTGEYVSEEEIVQEATASGLYNNGTHPDDFGKILSAYDIDYHVSVNGTTADLIRELVYGRKVMVAVDGGELLSNPVYRAVEAIEDVVNDIFGFQAADHAIWFTGVDLSDPSDIKVIINDSGVDDGAGKSVSLSVFRDAWEDSGFHYVATDEPPPDLEQIVSDFDAETGTFPDVSAYFEEYFPGFLDDGSTYDGIGLATTFDNLMADDPYLAGTLGAAEVKVVKALLEAIERIVRESPDLLRAIKNAMPELVQQFKQDSNTLGYWRALRVFVRHFHDEVEEQLERIRNNRSTDTRLTGVEAIAAIAEGQPVTPMTVSGVMDTLDQGQPGIAMVDTGGDSADIVHLHLDTEDPANPRVILSSGGMDQVYTMNEFIDAWTGINFHYIVMDGTTQEIPPTVPDPSGVTSSTETDLLKTNITSVDEITRQITERAEMAVTDEDYKAILADLEEYIDPNLLQSFEVRDTLTECIPWEHLWTYQGFYRYGDIICGVVSQKIILEAFGTDIPVDTLVQEAINEGELLTGPEREGMIWNNIGKLIERRGIDFEKFENLSITNVETLLNEGRMVLAVLDAKELWAEDTFVENVSQQVQDIFVSVLKTIFNSLSPEDQAEIEEEIGREVVFGDHVLIVSKIDWSDPDNPMVVVVDTGDPFGAGNAYPLDKFMDAWKDADYRALVTEPAPGPACLLESDEANMRAS